MAEDRAAKRLERMTALSSQKRGNFPIRSSYTSIQELLAERGDEFKSVADLDSFNYCSVFKDAKTLSVYNRLYRLPPNHKFVFANGSDRSCHWRPEYLCVYRESLIGGLRFPVHPFIVKLLADAQVSPCQIAPNAWRAIITYLVISLKKGFQPSVAVFRKIFQFRNSSSSSLGWVFVAQRAGRPHIYDGKSIPENNPKWKSDFLYIHWEGGDWGTLFRKSFGRVSDGCPDHIVLSEEDQLAYNELIKDDGQSHYRTFLDEVVMREVGISPVSHKGNPFSPQPFSFLHFCFIIQLCANIFSFSAALAINEALGDVEETRKMKRARIGTDDRGAPTEPSFLRGCSTQIPEVEAIVAPAKSSAFQPAWGLRKQDTVVGSSIHSKEWSLHSIPPCDYKDIVLGTDPEVSEQMGAQALATVSVYTFVFPFSSCLLHYHV